MTDQGTVICRWRRENETRGRLGRRLSAFGCRCLWRTLAQSAMGGLVEWQQPSLFSPPCQCRFHLGFSLGALIRRLAADKPPQCRPDRNVASATSAPQTAQNVWTKAPSPKAELPPTSDSTTWRRCQFKRLVRQLPPFARSSGLIPARGKHKQYSLGDRTVRSAAALIWIVAALLIACSSESTSPPPQVGSETSTDARPLSATTTTGLPTTTTTTETTPAQPVPSATVGPPNLQGPTAASEAQPETATAQTATPRNLRRQRPPPRFCA